MIDNQCLRLSVNPNPFQSFININYIIKTNTLDNIQIDIFNSIGQKVQNILNETQPSGEQNIEFNMHPYSDGLYYLIVSYQDSFMTIPIIKLD